jgi:hypothetical protein
MDSYFRLVAESALKWVIRHVISIGYQASGIKHKGRATNKL